MWESLEFDKNYRAIPCQFSGSGQGTRVLRGAVLPARVAGTRSCGAGAGSGWTCCGAGAGAGWEILCARNMSFEPEHVNLISSKIVKHVDSPWVVCQHCAYDSRPAAIVTLLCNNPLFRNISSDSCHVVASEHFPTLPSYLVRNN